MSDLRPIETTWRGWRFRSRTEARWAVCLTAAGIAFEYERQGYDLPSGWYLPDFWLPKVGSYLEIKGQEPTEREERLLRELSKAMQREVYLAVGAPDVDELDPFQIYYGDDTVTVCRFDIPEKAFAAARAERFDGTPPPSPRPPKRRSARGW